MPGSTTEDWIAALRGGALADVGVEEIEGGAEIRRGEASVLVLSCDHVAGAPEVVAKAAAGERGLLLVGIAPDALSRVLSEGGTIALLDSGCTAEALRLAADGLLERVELRRNAAERIQQLSRYRYERGELVEIARAITQERDIDALLTLILEKSRYITGADAGSIYILEDVDEDGDADNLRFKLSQNDSLTFESAEFVIPISKQSIAGAAVMTKVAINIDDVYELDAGTTHEFDRSFDEKVGYRTVSMLTMPMINAQGNVIGVIQLINKKRDPRKRLVKPEDFGTEVIAFDERSEELLTTLAAQAGIALENALLYDEIRRIFEGFVRASVQAIEQRDPTTSGHSLRVSVLSCALAEHVDRLDSGPFGGVKFSRRDLQELQYASLLHDFGKIGVREEVLVKAKKLYPYQRDAVQSRMAFAIKSAEADALRRRVELMEQGAGARDIAALDEELAARRAMLRDAWETIEKANEPTVLSEGDFSRITEIGAITYDDLDGKSQSLLTPEDIVSLHITRGSLNPGEIEEIRSHVVHTYNFLARIPWGKSMAQVPDIAHAHHERLDGSGYPLGIASDAIPVQSKIMSICDIYDALTARDRPYKKALAAERAIQILGFEVKDGHLDAELVALFSEAEVYRASERDLQY